MVLALWSLHYGIVYFYYECIGYDVEIVFHENSYKNYLENAQIYPQSSCLARKTFPEAAGGIPFEIIESNNLWFLVISKVFTTQIPSE